MSNMSVNETFSRLGSVDNYSEKDMAAPWLFFNTEKGHSSSLVGKTISLHKTLRFKLVWERASFKWNEMNTKCHGISFFGT